MNKNTPKNKLPGISHLEKITSELEKCARCGECRAVCPIFDSLKWEKFSARGKVALTRAVLQGEMGSNTSYSEVINNCLLCLACVENCGSGVRLDRIILAARNQQRQEKGLPLVKKLAHQMLLKGHEIMDLFALGGSFSQYLLFKRIPRESGLKRRFPLPLVSRDRYIPALVHHSFRNTIPEKNPARKTRQTAVFFTGCLINYVYPNIGESIVKVLNRFQTDVIIPRRQNCCGAPAEVGGDLETARELARKNILTLYNYPHDIVTACASGGYMLKKIYPGLFDKSSPLYSKALAVAHKTYDISEYLVKKIGLHQIQQHLKQTPKLLVTYHDPCHLIRGQEVSAEPRRLLQTVFGNDFVEMADADRCCGSGGTYGLTHPETSLTILHKKTKNILDSSAQVVATACPGCMIQIKDGLARQENDMEVYHILELISHRLSNEHQK